MASGKCAVLVYPDSLLREGLVGILCGAGFWVAAESSVNADPLKLTAECRPSIALAYWGFSESVVLSIRELVQSAPGLAVVLPTRGSNAEGMVRVLWAGAKGYLSVGLPKRGFTQSFRRASPGLP